MDEDIKQLLGEVIQHVDDKAIETQRHFDVIAESLQHGIKQVAEGILVNTRQINVLQSDMDMVKETIGEVKVEITIIKEDVELIKNELSQKASKQEFVLLETRVKNFEQKV